MILVLQGTGDGKLITQTLVGQGYRVGALAATDYGRELAVEYGAILVDKNLNTGTGTWLEELGVQAVVDARHPFDGKGEDELARQCRANNIMYLRIGREETDICHELLHPVSSMPEAAQKAAGLGKTIFLTTGSHDLEHFVALQKTQGIRLVVRVLPEHKVVKKCQDMGIHTRDIVAMQGPFSKQINKALFKMYRAAVVVTKDSGRAGGTDTKIDAALALKIPVVIVKRPSATTQREYRWDEAVQVINQQLPLQPR
ncbi:precorrin-6A reductase [Desulfallas thermosapovorans]|uniref:Precorrin-6A/cobalt-precorrin-6A reductase n=1 Tax=Desulfallas thermosapovorans DSM 6562 TaxID=1121431 RepID=A0A5S4ZTN7_9FIRM|nr:precorrin-6A reductase [Desulfallas thermosapovorans]TYO96223.1 precorrin-6A/cobalt-precorrin-6A reductase [Desulfallas thermosapovorans DSM 6562]